MGKQQLDNRDLSDNDHSATHVLLGWVGKVEAFEKSKGFEATRKAVLADLREHTGHGISERKFQFYEDLVLKARNKEALFHVICNSYLCGAGLSAR